MVVGFYITKIDQKEGGIYQYALYLLRMLIKCEEIKQVVLFHSAGQFDNLKTYIDNPKVKSAIYNPDGRIKKFRRKLAEFYLTRYYLKKHKSEFPLLLYKFLSPERQYLNKFKIDFLHVPKQHAPAYRLHFPVIISMHDVQQFHFPEFFTPLERIYKSINYYISISEAEHVIVSYNHVKNDLLKYFESVKNKVTVCPVPIDEDWAADTPETPAEELREKYQIPETFILTPAATWEHKNHISVLEALLLLKQEGKKIFWVSTGHKTSFFSKLEEKVEKMGLNDQVKFTGVVPDADLKGLYRIAKLVVIPTLYEAGSGPLIEAMRYGTPVICSNVTSLPDTIGCNDFMFDPLDKSRIAELIREALNNDDFLEKNKANSIKRIQSLTVNNYQKEFIFAYRQAISAKPIQ